MFLLGILGCATLVKVGEKVIESITGVSLAVEELDGIEQLLIDEHVPDLLVDLQGEAQVELEVV